MQICESKCFLLLWVLTVNRAEKLYERNSAMLHLLPSPSREEIGEHFEHHYDPHPQRKEFLSHPNLTPITFWAGTGDASRKSCIFKWVFGEFEENISNSLLKNEKSVFLSLSNLIIFAKIITLSMLKVRCKAVSHTSGSSNSGTYGTFGWQCLRNWKYYHLLCSRVPEA